MGNLQKAANNQTPSDSAEFLAPINFDDFHNSIMGESSSNQFPRLGNGDAGSDIQTTNFQPANPWTNNSDDSSASRKARSNSIRRKGEPPRLAGPDSTAGSVPSVPTAASFASRSRRQGLAQTAVTNGTATRAPRKSIGPGSLPFSSASARRASLTTRKASADTTQTNALPRPRTQHLDPNGRLESKSFANLRSLKAKSLQAPARDHRETFLSTPRGTEYSRSSSTDSLQTPSKNASGKAAASSSSDKRISVIPPRATGLGARTISPTDARRMKRISMAPQAPPMPRTPTTTEAILPRPRSCAQSPCHIPRKSATPSSTRATPDPNRKSFSSGIPSSLTPNHNAARNSGHSIQPRLPQNFPASRIPTPKPRVENSMGSGEEEVPPVPAIPKAYESPKDGLEPSPNLASRKTSLPLDIGLLKAKRDSDSGPADDAVNVSARRGVKTPTSSTRGKKNLQPLKLPPLNLLPLGTPMTTKIESLSHRDTDNLKSHTPTTQLLAKTPSTPMTASKANFHGTHDQDDAMPATQPRSSTSHFLLNSTLTPLRALSTSSALGSFDISNTDPVPPYPSSLSKKPSSEFHCFRHKASGDYSPKVSHPPKLTGPRPQTQASAFSFNVERLSQLSTPSETDSYSVSGSSLRNRIALTRERSNSKTQPASEANPDHGKYDNMPPKLPSSGNWNGLPTAKQSSPTLRPTYLQSRHQSSICNTANPVIKEPSLASSEQLLALRRTVSNESAERNGISSRSASSIFSPVHKIISSAKLNAGITPRSSPNSIAEADELAADEEMRRLNSKRKDLENSAKNLDELRRKAVPKDRVSPAQALRMANLNIFERGEIIDFKDIYFCGTQSAKKHVGDLNAQSANFGYDDDRGDYNIVIGDHLAYRYEVSDVLGKGSFGQVVRCIDHKTGGLVAVKIIRNKKRFHQQALIEVNLLQKLKEWVSFAQIFIFGCSEYKLNSFT